MEGFVVYTALINDDNSSLERWFYDYFKSEDKANECAEYLNVHSSTLHGVCEAKEVKKFEIQNLPYWIK